jgi:hypothetical protein
MAAQHTHETPAPDLAAITRLSQRGIGTFAGRKAAGALLSVYISRSICMPPVSCAAPPRSIFHDGAGTHNLAALPGGCTIPIDGR